MRAALKRPVERRHIGKVVIIGERSYRCRNITNPRGFTADNAGVQQVARTSKGRSGRMVGEQPRPPDPVTLGTARQLDSRWVVEEFDVGSVDTPHLPGCGEVVPVNVPPVKVRIRVSPLHPHPTVNVGIAEHDETVPVAGNRRCQVSDQRRVGVPDGPALRVRGCGE